MLEVVKVTGRDDLAQVFVARTKDGSLIEFVESVQPPVPRDKKWVLIVSTLKGCPVRCPICDAGSHYRGKLSTTEILAQIEHLVRRRYPDGVVPIPKLKVQFARMGEPALNDAVLEVLRLLPQRLRAPGLMPCVSTVAPRGRESFFEELLAIKQEWYPGGRFQMQFSLHASDETTRRALVPIDTWSFTEMAAFGRRFFAPGDRRVTLNFAAGTTTALDAGAIAREFDPRYFAIKLTPINPTAAARRAKLLGRIDPDDPTGNERLADSFRALGFETIVSIGELEENAIGSNCGMLAESSRRAALSTAHAPGELTRGRESAPAC